MTIKKVTLHGIFMEILGMGVLIIGEPAIGKGELALELIVRGNCLIADDAPEFSYLSPGVVKGSCPPLLHEFLEVRSLGILNIRAMYGDQTIKWEQHLQLILRLLPIEKTKGTVTTQKKQDKHIHFVLDVPIPVVDIPADKSRNLAVLVEAAVRNEQLKRNGYDAMQVFFERQKLCCHKKRC